MKKLNELVELAKKATPGKWWIDSHGHSMVAFSGEAGDVEIVFTTDNDMGPLVRHGETGNLSHWRNDNDATFIAAANPETILAIAEAFRDLEKRAESAEAKLAELEKQEPVAYRWEGKESGNICYDGIKPLGVISQPLFTRPLPAADLAELVPDECPEGITDKMEESAGISLNEEDCQGLWSVCRAAILRNIEEAE